MSPLTCAFVAVCVISAGIVVSNANVGLRMAHSVDLALGSTSGGGAGQLTKLSTVVDSDDSKTGSPHNSMINEFAVQELLHKRGTFDENDL